MGSLSHIIFLYIIQFSAEKSKVEKKRGNMDIYSSLLKAIEQEYAPVRSLKEGTRGSVSVVRHRKSGRRYVFRHFSGSGEVYRKLLTVLCPHLPQIYEVGIQDANVAVLEEYVQGDTLAYLLQGGLLPPEEARRITKELCQGLWVLHSMGAVHRDIKPENVILRGSEAVLIDFDASRLYKDESDGDTRILGTTGYAAPEQYGITQSDQRADIYSLGVLLNIMITGEHPSKKLASGRIGQIVQRCTMTAPKQRYQTVLALMERL